MQSAGFKIVSLRVKVSGGMSVKFCVVVRCELLIAGRSFVNIGGRMLSAMGACG